MNPMLTPRSVWIVAGIGACAAALRILDEVGILVGLLLLLGLVLLWGQNRLLFYGGLGYLFLLLCIVENSGWGLWKAGLPRWVLWNLVNRLNDWGGWPAIQSLVSLLAFLGVGLIWYSIRRGRRLRELKLDTSSSAGSPAQPSNWFRAGRALSRGIRWFSSKGKVHG